METCDKSWKQKPYFKHQQILIKTDKYADLKRNLCLQAEEKNENKIEALPLSEGCKQ